MLQPWWMVKVGLGAGRHSPRLGYKVGGWVESRIVTGGNLSWVALICGLNVEPESMVNLAFVKNDSYEKGPDSVVVHVYVKEICRDTSRVLFREQDFTLIFQTRWVVGKSGADTDAPGRPARLILRLPRPCSASAGMETS